MIQWARSKNKNTNMKRLLTGIALSALIAIPTTQAASSSTTILDFGAFGGYTEANMGQTFSGTGFIGMYGTAQNGGDYFAHLFGIEGNGSDDYSRTVGQVDVDFLNGQTILSASFEFFIVNNYGGGAGTFTGFDNPSGEIGYIWDAPGANLGNAAFSPVAGWNAIDVTDIVQDAADGNTDWLGFHLQSGPGNNWTYTSFEGDEAQVRLVVEYGEQPVPEVQHYAAMLGAAMAGVEMMRRRRKA